MAFKNKTLKPEHKQPTVTHHKVTLKDKKQLIIDDSGTENGISKHYIMNKMKM
jgi:hypothetical protein